VAGTDDRENRLRAAERLGLANYSEVLAGNAQLDSAEEVTPWLLQDGVLEREVQAILLGKAAKPGSNSSARFERVLCSLEAADELDLLKGTSGPRADGLTRGSVKAEQLVGKVALE
jgi:hypothetical protein